MHSCINVQLNDRINKLLSFDKSYLMEIVKRTIIDNYIIHFDF